MSEQPVTLKGAPMHPASAKAVRGFAGYVRTSGDFASVDALDRDMLAMKYETAATEIERLQAALQNIVDEIEPGIGGRLGAVRAFALGNINPTA